MMSRSLAVLAAALVPLFPATAALALDGVVASIKPVHSLVAAVMEGVAEPQLLAERGGFPAHLFDAAFRGGDAGEGKGGLLDRPRP